MPHICTSGKIQNESYARQEIVTQGYDGPSVMSGRCSGVQQQVKQVAPQAVYVHCYAPTA